MMIEELKVKVAEERKALKGKSGVCFFGENGPVGIGLIDAIVEVLEAQQRRVDKLERRRAVGE